MNSWREPAQASRQEEEAEAGDTSEVGSKAYVTNMKLGEEKGQVTPKFLIW